MLSSLTQVPPLFLLVFGAMTGILSLIVLLGLGSVFARRRQEKSQLNFWHQRAVQLEQQGNAIFNELQALKRLATGEPVVVRAAEVPAAKGAVEVTKLPKKSDA